VRKKIILLGVVLIVGLAGYIGYNLYKAGYMPNVSLENSTKAEVYIRPGQSLEALLDTLNAQQLLRDPEGFKRWAERKKLESSLKPGRYVFRDGQTSNSVVNMVASGSQTPLNVTLHDIIDIYDLAGTLDRYLMTDSVSFLSLFKDEAALQVYGLEPRTLTGVFLPNTYEFYWTASPEDVLKRMKKEYDRFWTEERVAKAARVGLSPMEAVTLASIVEKETVKSDEKPLVARLYLNRLEQGIKMESDPTVIYGINLDYPKRRITRVYYKDLEYASPYNTYRNAGLPPGPIKIPAISSIEAVLNAPAHNYIFMVADPARPGYHNFAVNYRQHVNNVNVYRRSLQ
jgi:UPF0755 protein